MAGESENYSQLETAHVLFMDIVSYSKLPIDQQSELLGQLNKIVRGTEQFRAAEAAESRPNIKLRMGVDSGPVDLIMDVNDRPNVAGAGINMAQRVMDCGD